MASATTRLQPEIVLFDLDGTLADIAHRRHFVESDPKDWRSFYAACPNDWQNYPVCLAFDAHKEYGHEVWIVSGRSDEVKEQTENWLKEKALVPDRLIMRKASDHQPDHKLKRSWLHDGTIPRERVICVYDDRDSVVAMWRKEGLACFQVAPGAF